MKSATPLGSCLETIVRTAPGTPRVLVTAPPGRTASVSVNMPFTGRVPRVRAFLTHAPAPKQLTRAAHFLSADVFATCIAAG